MLIQHVVNPLFLICQQLLSQNAARRRRRKRRAEYKKYIYSRKGKLNEKNLCTPINPKKYSCYGLKLKLMKEFDNEKNFLGTKIPHPPPPITLLMVRP